VPGRPIASKLSDGGRSTKLIDVLVATAAIALVAAPLVGRFNAPLDFVNHLWVVWAAGKSLVQAGPPSYFINTTAQGVFDPWFAFYGGTLYEATGAISELIGTRTSPTPASPSLRSRAPTWERCRWGGSLDCAA
jgi:hypothetical protein